MGPRDRTIIGDIIPGYGFKSKKVLMPVEYALDLKYEAEALLDQAKEVASEASKTSSPRTRSKLKANVRAAIIIKYSSLQAQLTEIYQDPKVLNRSNIPEHQIATIRFINDEKLSSPRSSTLDEFNRILKILGKEPFVKGEAPFQDADLVRLLRNTLVHPTPEYAVISSTEEGTEEEQRRLVSSLRPKLNLDSKAYFPDSVLTIECVDWAFKAIDQFTEKFSETSGIKL